MLRASGVLMHISSLPGKFGIGTFGKNAYSFVDYLKESGQSYWQILPLCPTSYGDSPYQSFSTFAGNPYFIDLDVLCKQGYLKKGEYEDVVWADSEDKVDYARLYTERGKIFEKVQKNFFKNPPDDFEPFCKSNAFWLDDFALFTAVKEYFGGAPLDGWDDDIRRREEPALTRYRLRCAESINRCKMLQYLFYNQWYKLKKYANENGVKIIGDLPIYVAADSADVWSDPAQFMLDDDFKPIEVAGCPPDAFSEDGQLWGNPLYNWEYMRQNEYAWWVKRMRECLKIYDIVRIDHFRGFDSFYCIKAGENTARNGTWRKGPGMELFKELKRQLGDLPVIAEDLGFLTPSVKRLLKKSGFPGMKVLQFAFDSREESDYLPHNYIQNCVVYTGTHDNDTVLGWKKSAAKSDVKFAKEYLRCKKELNWAMNIAALSSVADTAILTMQDIIGLSGEARMNTPSTVGENWKWRALKSDINKENSEKLLYYTKLYSRTPREEKGKCHKSKKI